MCFVANCRLGAALGGATRSGECMSQQGAPGPRKVGLFLNPVPQRRVQFQADSAAGFDHLFLAADADEAGRILSTECVDLLIIDLDRFDRGIDLAPLGQLVRQRAGRPVLLLCAYGCGSWLTDLMRFGPLDYVVAPAGTELVNQRIASHFAESGNGRDEAAELRGLLALRSQLLDAVAGIDDPAELAGAVCVALASWPGVIHAAMFEVNPKGQLVLAAQEAPGGIDLASLPGLEAGSSLVESPLRQLFPALIAACGASWPGWTIRPSAAMRSWPPGCARWAWRWRWGCRSVHGDPARRWAPST